MPRAALFCPTKENARTRETLEQFCQGRREFERIPPSLKEVLPVVCQKPVPALLGRREQGKEVR